MNLVKVARGEESEKLQINKRIIMNINKITIMKKKIRCWSNPASFFYL